MARGSLALLCMLITYTQLLAWHARYDGRLGPWLAQREVFFIAHRLYWPWDGVRWTWQYAPRQPRRFLAPGAGAGFAGLLVMTARRRTTRAQRAGQPPPPTGYGSDTWATRRELRTIGLCGPTGIVLGRVGRQILRYDGDKNVLICMPPRSGKGTGVLIPSLLTPGTRHAVCVDVRGETFAATAGYRQTLGPVHRYELIAADSARHNPLLEVRVGTAREYSDAFLVADILVDPASAQERRDHWDDTARNMLTVGSLYLLYREPHPSLAALASFYSQPDKPLTEVINHIKEDAPTQTIAELAAEILARDPKEASAVQSSTLKALAPWRNPTIALNTDTSTFRIADFSTSAVPITLYLIVSPADQLVIRAPLRVFLNQFIRRLTEDGGLKDPKLDLFLDEFPFFGRLDFYVEHLALLGGYGIRSVLAIQDVPQLKHLYGDPDRILEKCHVQVYSAGLGTTTNSVISRQSGSTTAMTPQHSEQRQAGAWMARSEGTTEQQHARALLLPSEARRMPEDHLLLTMGGQPSAWIRKAPYWRDRQWAKRSTMPYKDTTP